MWAVTINCKLILPGLTINNLLSDLLICQTFFTKCSQKVNSLTIFTSKLSHYVYGIFITLMSIIVMILDSTLNVAVGYIHI